MNLVLRDTLVRLFAHGKSISMENAVATEFRALVKYSDEFAPIGLSKRDVIRLEPRSSFKDERLYCLFLYETEIKLLDQPWYENSETALALNSLAYLLSKQCGVQQELPSQSHIARSAKALCLTNIRAVAAALGLKPHLLS